MKNDNHVWDNKHPTAQMLGRWQPWHAGHQKLFEETLKKTGQVNIMVRDVKGVDDNPFDFETVKKNIFEALKDYKNRIQVTLVPNITNICYGSYDYAWYMAIALSIFATIVHYPIDETRLVRVDNTL